jgi:hypothetical protein
VADPPPVWHDARTTPEEAGRYLVIARLDSGEYVVQDDFFRRPSRLFAGTWDRGWTYALDMLPGTVVAWAEVPAHDVQSGGR